MPWVLPCSLNEALSGRFAKYGAPEDPGTIRQGVRGIDLAVFGSKPERLWRDAEQPGSLAQVEPRLDPVLCGSEDGDFVVGPERRHSFAGPAVALAGGQSISIEDTGDQIVIGDENELSDGGNDVCDVLLR